MNSPLPYALSKTRSRLRRSHDTKIPKPPSSTSPLTSNSTPDSTDACPLPNLVCRRNSAVPAPARVLRVQREKVPRMRAAMGAGGFEALAHRAERDLWRRLCISSASRHFSGRPWSWPWWLLPPRGSGYMEHGTGR